MCFDFSVPITWSDIISALSMIATVATVIVALNANYKSTQQLKSALKMQEQTKNVELMEKRVELVEDIQKDKTISKLTLKLLFTEEIKNSYESWRLLVDKSNKAQNDLDMCILKNIVGAQYTDARTASDIAHKDMSKEKERLLSLMTEFIAKSVAAIT